MVDDGSRDPAAVHAVCAEHGVAVIRHDVSGGAGAARNSGLAASSTPYVAFVDSDVVVPPSWAAPLLGHFADPCVGAVAPRVRALPPSRGLIGGYEERHSALDMGPDGGLVAPGLPIPYMPSTVLVVRRSAMGAGFDESLSIGEDVDLVWRLSLAGWRVRYEPAAHVWHDHRVRLRAFVARRRLYARSVGMLARRHPDALPATRVSAWMALPWALALAGHRRAALGAATVETLLISRKLRQLTDRPNRPRRRAGRARPARHRPRARAGGPAGMGAAALCPRVHATGRPARPAGGVRRAGGTGRARDARAQGSAGRRRDPAPRRGHRARRHLGRLPAAAHHPAAAAVVARCPKRGRALMDVTFAAWAALVVGLVVLLLADLFVLHPGTHEISTRNALWSTVGFIAISVAFGIGLGIAEGGDVAAQYFTGYLLEFSLSLDNVFVWSLILSAYSVPAAYQHRVLYYGIFGALALRGLFVLAGAELLARFEWIVYVFGALLIYGGVRLLRGRDERDPTEGLVARLLRRHLPTTLGLVGARLFSRARDTPERERPDRPPLWGVWYATPLLAVLVVIEASDVIFAVDSIPAIFGVTREPFIVFSATALALVGLRSLYFLLANARDRFAYLDVGLAVILIFIGGRFVLTEVVHISVGVSLLVIVGVMGTAIAASLLRTRWATGQPDWAARR